MRPMIAVDIFQPERQLIGIKALGAAAELRSLKLFDDRLEALDLAVAMLDGRRQYREPGDAEEPYLTADC